MNPLAYMTLLGDAAIWIWISLNLWGWGKGWGKTLMAALLFDVYLNYFIKISLKTPRPTEIGGLISGVGYGFPSGHAETVSLATTYMSLKDRRFSPLLVLIPVVGYTRVALNVHYPIDILGGTVIGILVAMVVYISERHIHLNKSYIIVSGFVIAAVTPVIYPIRAALLSGFVFGASAALLLNPHPIKLRLKQLIPYNLTAGLMMYIYAMNPNTGVRLFLGFALGFWGILAPKIIKYLWGTLSSKFGE